MILIINYFSIVKDGKQYKILDDKEYDENIRIAESIIREHFKDKPDYVITGKKHQVFGILITLKENNKNVIVPFGTSGRVNEYWTDNSKIRDGNIQTETFFNITSTNTYENFRKYLIETFEIDVSDKDKDYLLIRNDFCEHSTCFLISLKTQKIYLFDTSTWHFMNKETFFGELGNSIEMLNPGNLQINQTCSFWNTCFQIVVSKYKNIDDIIKDCNNGIIWLKTSAEMCKIFDINQTYPTVKEFEEEEIEKDDNKDKYIIFSIDEKNFGISKLCYNNRFVNIKDLVNSLGNDITLISPEGKETLKELLSEQIKKQDVIQQLEKVVKFYHKFDDYYKNLEKLASIKDKNKLKILKDKLKCYEERSLNIFLLDIKSKFDKMYYGDNGVEYIVQLEEKYKKESEKKFKELKEKSKDYKKESEKFRIEQLEKYIKELRIYYIEKLKKECDRTKTPFEEYRMELEKYNLEQIGEKCTGQYSIIELKKLKEDLKKICINYTKKIKESNITKLEEYVKSLKEDGGLPKDFNIDSKLKEYNIIPDDRLMEILSPINGLLIAGIVANGIVMENNTQGADYSTYVVMNNNIDLHIQETEQNNNNPSLLPLLDSNKNTDSDLYINDIKNNVIIFKTNNKKIFKDITEIKITLPDNVIIDKEYIGKLNKKIFEQGFNNELITLDNVQIRLENQESFQKMGEFINGYIASKRREVSCKKGMTI